LSLKEEETKPMTKLLILTAALCAAVCAQTVVVPNGNATVTGNDTSGSLVGSLSARIQTVISPLQLPAGPIYITGFTYRPAPGTGALNFTITGNIYAAYSATAAFFPNGLGLPLISTTFASNVGADNTLVFSGTTGITGPGCALPGPCAFGSNIAFTTPFAYNRANGPLLIDIQATNTGGPGPGQFDVIDCASSACVINGVAAVPSSPTTGTYNGGGSITQVSYSTILPGTPVPPSILLTLLGLACVGFFVGRRGLKFA